MYLEHEQIPTGSRVSFLKSITTAYMDNDICYECCDGIRITFRRRYNEREFSWIISMVAAIILYGWKLK